MKKIEIRLFSLNGIGQGYIERLQIRSEIELYNNVSIGGAWGSVVITLPELTDLRRVVLGGIK